MINLLHNIWAISVPSNANTFDFNTKYGALVYYAGQPSFGSIRTVTLPEGNWRILFTSDTSTEEDCAKVVERHQNFKEKWASYVNKGVGLTYYNTARASFASLLRSHNLNGRYLIIEKMD